MNPRGCWLFLLVASSILSGCHQRDERGALEYIAGHAEQVLAEEQDLAAHLPERRLQADRLFALRETDCPPADLSETARRVEKLAAPAEVSADGDLLYTVRGSGGPYEAGGVLGRLSANAGYLSLHHFEVTNTTWMAQLAIATRCPPLPQPRFSAFPLPPKTDWLRARPEELRVRIAATERRVHALEGVLWDEPSVLTINHLKRDVEAERRWNAGTEAIRGQVKLVSSVLRDSDPGRFVADFDGDAAHLEAEAPLDHAPRVVEDLWEVRREQRCRLRWCASGVPTAHALQERGVYAPTYRAAIFAPPAAAQGDSAAGR